MQVEVSREARYWGRVQSRSNCPAASAPRAPALHPPQPLPRCAHHFPCTAGCITIDAKQMYGHVHWHRLLCLAAYTLYASHSVASRGGRCCCTRGTAPVELYVGPSGGMAAAQFPLVIARPLHRAKKRDLKDLKT